MNILILKPTYQTTASESCLVSIIAARTRYMRVHPDVDLNTLVIYTTTQTHSLGTKAALILGLSTRALEVSASDAMGLRGATLREALKEDTEAGFHPFILSSWGVLAIKKDVIFIFQLLLFSCDSRHDVIGSYRQLA